MGVGGRVGGDSNFKGSWIQIQCAQPLGSWLCSQCTGLILCFHLRKLPPHCERYCHWQRQVHIITASWSQRKFCSPLPTALYNSPVGPWFTLGHLPASDAPMWPEGCIAPIGPSGGNEVSGFFSRKCLGVGRDSTSCITTILCSWNLLKEAVKFLSPQ